MRQIIVFGFFIIGILTSWGCKKSNSYKDLKYDEVSAGISISDPKFPKSLWKHIQEDNYAGVIKPMSGGSKAEATGEQGKAASSEAGKSEHGEAAKTEHGSSAEAGNSEHGEAKGGSNEREALTASGSLKTMLNKNEAELLPAKVYLIEKNRGILGGNKSLELGKGGGEIDLSKWLSDKRGSFYIVFEPQEMPEGSVLKVYFLSRAKKRRVDGDNVGSGCNTYLDITSYYNKTMKKEGFLANTTDARHLSLLGGTFVFVVTTEKGPLQLTQVSVTDSRYPQLLCQNEE